MADGISFSREKDGQCIACLEGKQSWKPFKGVGRKRNGLAERTNRTLVEKTRYMMKKAGSDEKMCTKDVNTAAYLENRSPDKATGAKTPEE
ncbi:hypothetical protein PR048_012240 [Dryococelus australis]|uniref:Integrase catalytic domain-containing protein n=1 Tax=Dryococelus australis TaxID=614101 RepID=A0ABQ9HNS6_9NEOP|nr:hypothetical protein PR048_012240 [Dryococelus australis]